MGTTLLRNIREGDNENTNRKWVTEGTDIKNARMYVFTLSEIAFHHSRLMVKGFSHLSGEASLIDLKRL